jgi:serine/threonine protein kinase
MHKQGFSYRFLRPENILIKDSLNENHFTYYLDFPTLEFNQAEIVHKQRINRILEDFWSRRKVIIITMTQH